MIQRNIQTVLKRISKSFPVVLVTGARQTGKSTLLKMYVQNSKCKYITFDDRQNVISAKEDPKLFLSVNGAPCIFDEIQYVGDIFRYIKIEVDSNRKPGMFFLTGSQQFNMMKNVSESLAGRIGILTLLPISLREAFEDNFVKPFIPSKDFILKRNKNRKCIFKNPKDVWDFIQEGMYPEIRTGAVQSEDFYASYIRTYIERDVRQLTQVSDEMLFMQFIQVLAARTGQLVNYADVARTVGIDPNTAKKWLSILVTSGIVYLLQPYFGNIEKRIVKTPKLYFMDTGLASYLTKWKNPEVLMSGASSGAFFETFCVSEIIKSFTNAGIEPPLYFYRDSDGVEVDLLIENNGALYPVEFKQTATPQKDTAKNFHVLNHIKDKKIENAVVVCNCKDVGLVEKDVLAVPVGMI